MNRTKRPKCLTDKAKKKLAGKRNFRVNNQVRVDNLAKHKAKQRAKGKRDVVQVPLATLTVKKLKALLKKHGIKIPAKSKKIDLVILAEGAK